MTRAGTKTTVKRQDVKKRKMDNIYKEVTKLTKDKKVADQLIAKYGVDCAYAIVRQSMLEPTNVMKRIGSTHWKNSADTIKYFASTNLSDATVAKGIRKTQSFVAESKKNVVSTPHQVAKKNPRIKQTTTRVQNNNQAITRRTRQHEIAKTKSSIGMTTPSYTNILKPIEKPNGSIVFETPFTRALQNSTDPFSNVFQPKKKTIEEQVEDELAKMKKNNPNGITLGCLKNDGFSINNKTLKESDFKYLHAGKDGKGLGEAVQDATRSRNGENQCGRAVRVGYSNYMNQAHKDEGIPRSNSEGEFYGRYCEGSTAASTLYKAFENDCFTVLRYPSGKSGNPSLNNVPDGSTVFFDKPKGRRITTRDGTTIRHPGHTATYHDGQWWQGNSPQAKSTISGEHYANYGSHYRIAIANDTKVDDELARKIIRAKIEENERLANSLVVRHTETGRC